MPSSKLKIGSISIVALWIVLAGIPLYQAFDYYLLPLHDRPYSSLHELFKPSGVYGHGLGIVGSLMMIVGVSTYSFRKRSAILGNVGKISSWLTFHIFLCTLGPFYVMLHTTFRFNGIVSISFWSMAAVVASGIFGRYVYVRIPKSLNGRFLEAKQLRSRKAELVTQLESSGIEDASVAKLQTLIAGTGNGQTPKTSLLQAIGKSIGARRARRHYVRKVTSVLGAMSLTPVVSEKLRGMLVEHHQLRSQLEIIRPFQRLFGYWHVFHLPLAIIMFLILFVHVGVAITFGYAWIF